MMIYDLIIVGGGAAGMLAAIEAKKKGMKNVAVIEKDLNLGGFLNLANYNISESENIIGQEYKEKLLNEYKELEIKTFLNTMVLNINDKGFIICMSPEAGIFELKAENTILANGAKDKGRNILSMPGDRCSGVITLGMAKRFLNIDGINFGNEVIIYGTENLDIIFEDFKRRNIKIKAIIGNKDNSLSLTNNIYEDFKIKEILGNARIESITITNGTKEETLKCSTLIIASGMLSDGIVAMRSNIKMNPETTGPKVNENLETSRNNIYACGNGIFIHKSIESINQEVKKLINHINEIEK